jgi:hypothetical protein
MAGPPSNLPSSSLPTVIPVGSNVPAAVKTSQLDNPPKTRASHFGTSAHLQPQTPFENFAAIDLFNLKEALETRLAGLNPDSEDWVSTKRLLSLATVKLAPKQPKESQDASLLYAGAAAPGVRPIPPVKRPGR